MAKRTIEYRALELKTAARVLLGRAKSTSITALEGVRITRVIEDGRADGGDVFVEGPKVQPGTEIPWSNVASAVREVGK